MSEKAKQILSELKKLNSRYLYMPEGRGAGADEETKARLERDEKIYKNLRKQFAQRTNLKGVQTEEVKKLKEEYKKLPSLLGLSVKDVMKDRGTNTDKTKKGGSLSRLEKKQVKLRAGGSGRDEPISIFKSQPRPELADKLNRGGSVKKGHTDRRKGMFYK